MCKVQCDLRFTRLIITARNDLVKRSLAVPSLKTPLFAYLQFAISRSNLLIHRGWIVRIAQSHSPSPPLITLLMVRLCLAQAYTLTPGSVCIC